jgi:peptidoglycan/xylan/chitin deacetylase (PgdA/CDA1 family)
MKTVVLTFDDACKSHLHIAAPILKKYGFGATFFISLPQEWLDRCPEGFMSWEEIAELHKMGFELGNHTVSHRSFLKIEEDDIRSELEAMNKLLADIGEKNIVSFAYPGGPYAPRGADIIPEFDLKYARTTEHGLWTKDTELMRIPCFSVCDKQEENFRKAINMLDESENGAAVLLYHGVPDVAHAHCSTKKELFESHMKYLFDNNYKVE